MLVQIRPVPDAPRDIPALLSPESTLPAQDRLMYAERWANDIRDMLHDPCGTSADLPAVAAEMGRLVRWLAGEIGRMCSAMPPSSGLSVRRCTAAGEDCRLAGLAYELVASCAASHQARMITRLHGDWCLRLVRSGIAHLRAALRFEEVDA